MEDILRDYGFKPQGKSVPMAANKTANSTTPNFNFNFSANNTKTSSLNDVFSANPGRNTYSSGDFNSYDDVFGGPPQYKAPASQSSGYDDIFQSFSSSASTAPPVPSSGPEYDAPRYDDDDIFGGVPGVKSSTPVAYDDVFSVGSVSTGPSNIEDLLGGFRSSETGTKARAPTPPPPPVAAQGEPGAFDDLLPGFGSTEPPKPRVTTDTKPQKSTDSSQKPASDPFVILEADSFSSNGSSATFHDPLEDFGIPSESSGINDRKGSSNGTVEINDIFDGFPQSVPSVSPPVDDFGKGRSPLKASQSSSPPQNNNSRESVESKSPKKSSVNNLEKNHAKIYSDAPVTDFDLPSGVVDASTESNLNRNKDSFHEDSTFPNNNNFEDTSPPGRAEKGTEVVCDKWITVDDVQLFTQPTSAPPPSRPPPPLVIKQGPSSKKNSDFMSVAHSTAFNVDKPSVISSIDELEEFAMGSSSSYAQYEEDADSNSTAAASVAAMKEAMDRAEAKIKMAKKVREREKEAVERASEEAMDDEEKERLARAAQEIREREEREREEREKERLRIEREREKEREREREREKQRIAVERATREARERAAAEAREKAQRAAVERATKEARERAAAEAKERAEREARERVEREAREREARVRAERAAAERAAAEARERAEKAAVERAATEARERAAAEARERVAAERAAVDRAAAEVRLRAQRAAVERATAEVRGRAAERASAERAAAAKEKQMRNDNDFESFFSMGARPNSAPRQRPPDAVFNAQSQNKGFSSEGPQRTSAGVPSGVRKSSSAANIIDDWTSIFTAPSADEFQEVEGETAERRKARLERHQRTRERTAKALAEKNERDMQAQRDQAERHRMAETLDLEIKRWATGKEGNLRALLSTLQHVLWPEAGWQPVGLTDVITAAAVKKVYRKATLCVHPDKVQQKGATIQQKYIAEKVFDLLKEAWNKFNSEELF